MHRHNIEDMYTAVEVDRGFDVIIIVSSSSSQAEFWQDRLHYSIGKVMSRKTQVVSVEEDWPGGAGQLLGTLYAWEKANKQIDLNGIIENGGTVAMYHTAGKGTRMAPIPAAEANNKSAIKLPRLIEVHGKKIAITVLEAVIFQTGIFAASRKGRLCVFWGDQVFIPSESVDFGGAHHAEILAIRGEIPSNAETWQRDWQSYGLVIPDPKSEGALQREKQSWAELQGLIDRGTVKSNESGKTILGKSLGCFSVSSALLYALLEEFSAELAEKQSKMDTDPHLWMPLTSTREEFELSGGDKSLWERIDRFKKSFSAEGMGLFGDKDLGSDTLWWDYGQVQLYYQNFIKLLEDSSEGECLRQFFDLESYWVKSFDSDALLVENSMILDSSVKGRIKNSILVGVSADELNVTDSVVIESSLSRASASGALIYTCTDETNMELSSEEVLADVFLPKQGKVRMRTALSRDGKEDWGDVILGNPYSFAELKKLVEER
ncbi:MAG: hypothetical protein SVM79_09355 [Chloroflexota bacterium]|nr:hypothetical protein [Chloroflexota bacterium]